MSPDYPVGTAVKVRCNRWHGTVTAAEFIALPHPHYLYDVEIPDVGVQQYDASEIERRQQTCDERIGAQAAGRLEDLAVLVAFVEADDDPDTIAAMTVGQLRAAQDCGVNLGDILGALVPASRVADDDTAESLHGLKAGVDVENDPVDAWPEDFVILCDVLRDEGTGLLSESARECLDEYGLSLEVETVHTLRWVFGTGGPHDEIACRVSPAAYQWEVDDATFVLKDWFDGARSPLTGDDLATVRQALEIVGALEPGVILPADGCDA